MFYIFLLILCLIAIGIGYLLSNKLLLSFLFSSSLFLLFLISSLRYNIGTDYINYVKLYYDLNHVSFENANIELGFYLIVKLCHFLNTDVQLMFSLMAGIAICIFFSRHEMRTFWGMFAFICIIYLPSYSLI
ncbi:EpsG family protein, partial [Citrobacter sedlakii]